MEDIKQLYDEFEAEVISKRPRGHKAEKIRQFIIRVSDFLDKKQLARDALYKLADRKLREPDARPLDKTYFNTVIDKCWEVERDEHGVFWVFIDRPK